MDYKELYPKLDKEMEDISQEELCSFARTYALCNTDMALALVEKYLQPDAADYKQIVDACFVHPFIVSTKYGESLDWNAVTNDVLALMQRIHEDKKGKDIIGAAQMALYLLVRTSEEYEKDHPYKETYSEAWAERWRPLCDAMLECDKIVCELLIDREDIDDDTQRGLIGEMAGRLEALKKGGLINMEFVWEDIQEKVLSQRRYLTYLNNKIKKGFTFDLGKNFGRKLKFLNKIGKRKEAMAAIDEMVIGDKDTPCRAPAIDSLIEWGEYEKALAIIRSSNEFDIYALGGDIKEKLLLVLKLIGDTDREIAILKEEFAKASSKKLYYNRFHELLDNQEWEEFIDSILADAAHIFEHDFDEIEAQIYLERKEYDKLILFCRRNTYQADDNLSKYGKFMPLADQKEAAEYIANRTKHCIADCKRSKDYAYHVDKIQHMIDSCEGGKMVVKELIQYLYDHYGNRPALVGMLRKLKDV